MSIQSGQSGNDPTDQKALTIRQALDLALQHHTMGRLSEAEGLYQYILQASPEQPDALHLLGLIAQQTGKNDVAIDLITRAIAVKPDFSRALSNLGNILQDLDRNEEAVTACRQALAIDPDHAETYNNLGCALLGLGNLDEAEANCHQALVLKPDYAGAHTNLGNILRVRGSLNKAVVHYSKAITLKPDNAEAHNNLGVTLKDLGRHDDAIANYHKALAINPDYAEAHNNLGATLVDVGLSEEAFACQRRAIALNPANESFWIGLARTMQNLSFTSVDDATLQDLLCLMERSSVHANVIIRPIISALCQSPDFSNALEQAVAGKPVTGSIINDRAGRLSSIPLLLRIMEYCTIPDLKIERMLTVLRQNLIEQVLTGKLDEEALPFLIALALQCFTNEYVYLETDEETIAIKSLQQQIATLVDKQQDVPVSFIAMFGAYRPLYRFLWAGQLRESSWAGDIRRVIKRLMTEPQEELSLRSQIPDLTAIQGTVSQLVREQYEENPYPRWTRIGMHVTGKAIGPFLQGAPANLDLGNYVSPESPEILVAGCGTGQHALNTALKFSNARVLAIDLSLSSLSYAVRKTKELGISNIEYAQADIMELGNIERQFDLIECVGVLHHLEDPLAGWRILVDLLRPGGIMMIGLYSEAARQDIVEGRSLVAEKGYTTSAHDIRQCRQDIIALTEDGIQMMASISRRNDFFSLSECRDLLFHVQEHRFTLPQVKVALKTLKLEFLGFDMQNKTAQNKFKETYPKKRALKSLSLWNKFELRNPDTFRGMYPFWCRKME